MPVALSKEDRNFLARVTLNARETAEKAARAALENLAVHEKDYRSHMGVEARQLRNRLRARGRALGDPRDERTGTQGIDRLVEDVAYEQWHRLLFTRFLSENHLLHTDEAHGSVPVTLQECEELAPELEARDGFDLACRFASRTLPGVFRADDPVLEVRLAQNDEVALRRLLDSLPPTVFRSDDGLGWTYQFWQAKRKDGINESGVKVGAQELPAVTQLFTESYMVEFLLHNTLGAWWAGRRGPLQVLTEEDARQQASLPPKDGLPAIAWTHLRFVQDEVTKAWMPAAGPFPGWPAATRDVRLLDPCMGSGHFVVAALPLLARMRMEDERLSAAQAIQATLRDNLFNLEIDERCTQIAAFNVALTAWKLGGYQPFMECNIACSGLAPNAPETAWTELAGADDRLRRGMARLYALFNEAPLRGSLINPRIGGDLVEADFHEIQPLLTEALRAEKGWDSDRQELCAIAEGLAKAAEMLSARFTLVATNVPYLGIRHQSESLVQYCAQHHPTARHDLANCFIQRMFESLTQGGSQAVVAPQSWLFSGSYARFRTDLLRDVSWQFVAPLGPGAFETISGEVVNVALFCWSRLKPSSGHTFAALGVEKCATPEAKATGLLMGDVKRLDQAGQLSNPDGRVVFEPHSSRDLLSKVASSLAGIQNGDSPRYLRCFWELKEFGERWAFMQSAVRSTALVGGLDTVIDYDSKNGHLRAPAAWRREALHDSDQRGKPFWGKEGVTISRMGSLPCARYFGSPYDQGSAVIVPNDVTLLPALWAYCSSPEYNEAVRRIDKKLNVTSATLTKVPFDVQRWQRVAAQMFPGGLPKPQSINATQWLFGGHPKGAQLILHVAVARLVGYRWPRQDGASFPGCPALDLDSLDAYADEDGVVCLSPVSREQPAAARLRALLAAALGERDERSLVTDTGSRKSALEDWLRDEFFDQHCELFQQRPFIWHLWDGRKDGFHALVNYHRLDHATLKKLAYSYLGDWIRQQQEEASADKQGAGERLGAARRLQGVLAKILEGEPPYDIFVRWKSLATQSVGWNPDLNDGVRLNIRPFMLAQDVGKKGAGIFRTKPGIKWDKDRGTEPRREKDEFPWFWCEEDPGTDPVGGKSFIGNRWNSTHLTLARKRAARNGR